MFVYRLYCVMRYVYAVVLLSSERTGISRIALVYHLPRLFSSEV